MFAVSYRSDVCVHEAMTHGQWKQMSIARLCVWLLPIVGCLSLVAHSASACLDLQWSKCGFPIRHVSALVNMCNDFSEMCFGNKCGMCKVQFLHRVVLDSCQINEVVCSVENSHVGTNDAPVCASVNKASMLPSLHGLLIYRMHNLVRLSS